MQLRQKSFIHLSIIHQDLIKSEKRLIRKIEAIEIPSDIILEN